MGADFAVAGPHPEVELLGLGLLREEHGAEEGAQH
jgi:hypothetical protein